MSAILKFQELQELNFKLAVNISEDNVNRVITDIEQQFINENLSIYDELIKNENNKFDEALPELKLGIANLVYGYLMLENIDVTRFGAVKKQSNFSNQAQRNEIEIQASYFFKRGCNILMNGFLKLKQIDSSIEILETPRYNYLKGFYKQKLKES